MTILFSIDVKKQLKLGGGQILDGMRAIKALGETQSDVVTHYEANDKIARLTLSTTGHRPYLTLEYNPNTFMFVGFVNHWYAGRTEKFLMGLPIKDFGELLRKATCHQGVWKLVTTELFLFVDVNNVDDFTQYLYGESLDVWRAGYMRNKEAIISAIWYLMNYATIGVTFESWTKNNKVSDGVIGNYIPLIEEEHPGFIEALKEQYDERILEQKVSLQKTITCRIQHLSTTVNNDVLNKVFTVRGWMASQLNEICRDAKLVGFEFEYPADISPTLKGLVDGAISSSKVGIRPADYLEMNNA